MEQEVYKKLKDIESGKEVNYDLFVAIDEYKKYVKLGRNYRERLQILIMCYVDSPTLYELNNWDLAKILEYIRETDDMDFYGQDMEEITKCVKLILEMDENIESCTIKLVDIINMIADNKIPPRIVFNNCGIFFYDENEKDYHIKGLDENYTLFDSLSVLLNSLNEEVIILK